MENSRVLENQDLDGKSSLGFVCALVAVVILLTGAGISTAALPVVGFYHDSATSFLTSVANPFLHWLGFTASADWSIAQATALLGSHHWLAALLLSFSISAAALSLAAPYLLAAWGLAFKTSWRG